MNSLALILLLFCGIAFAGGGILLSKALAKTSKNLQKGLPYECGVPTIGTTWIQFNVGYYLFALIFLIFDVELVFMYPWAVNFKSLGKEGLMDMFLFMILVLAGFLYIILKGAFKWDKR